MSGCALTVVALHLLDLFHVHPIYLDDRFTGCDEYDVEVFIDTVGTGLEFLYFLLEGVMDERGGTKAVLFWIRHHLAVVLNIVIQEHSQDDIADLCHLNAMEEAVIEDHNLSRVARDPALVMSDDHIVIIFTEEYLTVGPCSFAPPFNFAWVCPYHVVLRGSGPSDQYIVITDHGNVLVIGATVEFLHNIDSAVDNLRDASGLQKGN